MICSPQRRSLLRTLLAAPFALAAPLAFADTKAGAGAAPDGLAALEREHGGRLGVYARDTGSGAELRHRADERFPFCSTFKILLVGAILARSASETAFLTRRIAYTRRELAHYSPITSQHVGAGMTVAELCQAAIQYSDNTAANLLMKQLGGPAAVTAFARSIGDETFRLDRWETALNSAVPGDPRDTSSPAAMAHSLETLALGAALPAAQRTQLQDWLRGNTTGDKRIRAGVPAGWAVADKTGTGDYGAANDLALLWPPARAPIVLAVYHTHAEADAKPDDGVIAAAARIVSAAFA